MTRVLILNGPNLNLLGTREPQVYGTATLADLEADCRAHANRKKIIIDFRQSNHEGQLLDWLHDAPGAFDGVILNAGALTHTSIALMDALRALPVPVVDVHLSNIHAREAERRVSYPARAAVGSICGFGPYGYVLAMDAVIAKLG